MSCTGVGKQGFSVRRVSPMNVNNMTPNVIDLTSDDDDNAVPGISPQKRMRLSADGQEVRAMACQNDIAPHNNAPHSQNEYLGSASKQPIMNFSKRDRQHPSAIQHLQTVQDISKCKAGNTMQAIVTSSCHPGILSTGQDSDVHENGGAAQSIQSLHSSAQKLAKNGSHQFWKAGDYDMHLSIQSTNKGAMERLRVNPKFLHSNATSHKWAFGAIAELLDNAIDEIPKGASYVKVDQIFVTEDRTHALLFQDDGGGMDPECIRQCMSLGYSSKNMNSTIGRYGNGFKTSTMRLGADAIVFTRTSRGRSSTQSIGLLSYTFLRMTGQDDIVVPMLDYELPFDTMPKKVINDSEDLWNKNLDIILKWSPYSSETDLMKQFDDIGLHGTKIIIYNLWLNDDNILELDFDTDLEDIRLRGGPKVMQAKKLAQELLNLNISNRLRYSLRAYTSILYLRKMPNFQIILRGKPVEHYSIADDLKFSKVITYKPQLGSSAKEAIVTTTIGFTKEAPLINVHGFNVYHKNRLIMPFWKVWQDNSSRGRGVVGVLEANFIEPAHDKQDFERTSAFLRLETKLKQMTLDYWKSNCDKIGYQGKNFTEFPQTGITVQNPRPLASIGPQLLSENNSSHGQSMHVPNTRAQQSRDSANLEDQETPASLQLKIGKLRDENLQLFMSCERRRLREMELNQMITKLKNDLVTAKSKNLELRSRTVSRGSKSS